MSVIVWSNNMSVGIDSIDQQHKKLINMINSLNTAMAKGEASAIIGKILDDLTSYTSYHFVYEEKLLDQHGYPNTTAHKRHHADLIEEIIMLKNRYLHDLTGSLSLEILQFLNSWLTHHIMKADMAYSKHLVAKGVK